MSNQQQNHALSEVFPLTVTQSNITGFRLTPSVDKELGNRLSFRFSQQFTGIIVIWNQGTFLVLSEINLKLSSQKEWKQALTKNQTIDDFKRSYWSFKWVSEPEVNSELIEKHFSNAISYLIDAWQALTRVISKFLVLFLFEKK